MPTMLLFLSLRFARTATAVCPGLIANKEYIANKNNKHIYAAFYSNLFVLFVDESMVIYVIFLYDRAWGHRV